MTHGVRHIELYMFFFPDCDTWCTSHLALCFFLQTVTHGVRHNELYMFFFSKTVTHGVRHIELYMFFSHRL